MATITIMDPVTRIEGHMKVEVSIEANRVADARCTGTLFRGFEKILVGRHPFDAPVITQRICGVCPISHAQASVLALEDVSGWPPPRNARILRNLTLGANFVQSHILHFYLLALLDYVPGPQAAPWTPAWNVDMRSGLDAAQMIQHFVEAIEARRRAHEMGAIFGGKMPSSHTYLPGGFTETPSDASIASFREQLTWLRSFINNIYLPDVEAVASVYDDYLSLGAGCRNLLAFGAFELDDSGQTKLLSRGFVEDGDTTVSTNFDGDGITESVSYSWYDDNADNRNPSQGETVPAYPKGDAYSWLKAPRYMNKPFEVGPLARMWANGDYRNGISVMDRHRARALETLKIAQAMSGWLDELQTGGPVYEDCGMPEAGVGVGMTEAPRGALGHWVGIGNRQIEHYQVVTPTCWNASPMDDQSVPGPMEQSLVGMPVADPDQPIEVLRVIHSFDPCLSCAVHVMKPRRDSTVFHAGPR